MLLIERRSTTATRGIWYHGTSAGLIPDILHQGLQIDPEKRAWGDDPHAGPMKPSRASNVGVYLTKSLMSAVGHGRRPAQRDKANIVLVVCDLQGRSLVADEDDLGPSLASIATKELVHSANVASWYWMAGQSPDAETLGWLKRARQEYVDSQSKFIAYRLGDNLRPRFMAKIRELVDGCWPLAVERAAAYYPREHGSNWIWSWRDNWNRYTGQPDEDAPNPPDPQAVEKRFAEHIERMTRTLKQLALRERTIPTARSTRSIGFSGANRIVAIVELIEGRPNYTLRLHYGRLPDDFRRQWEEGMGPLIMEQRPTASINQAKRATAGSPA